METPSGPGELNTRDLKNTLKHVVFVAGATALATLSADAPSLLTQSGYQLLIPLVTGILTLLSRWLQDNTR